MNVSYNFHNFNVIVTGGSRGIGASIVTAFAQAGANVGIVYRKESELADAVVQKNLALGVKSGAWRIDLAASECLEDKFKEIINFFGVVDVLVNNAADCSWKPLMAEDGQHWENAIKINLTAPFLLSRMAAKNMILHKRGGSIIHISTTAVDQSPMDILPYVSSKGGVEVLTKQLAVNLQGTGIRVNCIAAGLIDTESRMEQMSEGARKHFCNLSPLGRLGRTEEIANLALFLSSEASSFINGAVIVADGGLGLVQPPPPV